MPGLEHAPSAMTKRKDSDPYGCKDLPRSRKLVPVQDGWNENGTRRVIYFEDFGSQECRYDMSLTDKRCSGCEHAGSGERYDQMIRARGT